MTALFDPTPYVTTPVLSVAGGVALGSALLAACPREATAEVRKAAKTVRTRVVALQAAWAKRDKAGPAIDRRLSDQAVDNGWGALHGRLDSYAALPADLYPDAARASELKHTVYPDGLSFLKLPYPEEWAESDKRLRLIEEQKLEKDINRIAGPEFLEEVRRVQASYGEALGITRPTEAAPEVGVAEPLRGVQQAILRYALSVAALADDEDEGSLEAVRKALKPIDDYRAQQGRRTASTSAADPTTEVTPNTPVPEVLGSS